MTREVNPQLMMSALDEPSLLSPVPSVFICSRSLSLMVSFLICYSYIFYSLLMTFSYFFLFQDMISFLFWEYLFYERQRNRLQETIDGWIPDATPDVKEILMKGTVKHNGNTRQKCWSSCNVETLTMERSLLLMVISLICSSLISIFLLISLILLLGIQKLFFSFTLNSSFLFVSLALES